MKDHILLMTAYGSWADQKICSCIDQMAADKLDQEVQSSFPTVRQTMAHIYDAYRIWMDRLAGGQMNYWPSKELDPFTSQHLMDESKRLNRYAEGLNEQDFNKICTYKNLNGKAFNTAYFEVILHAVNHGTYHRGQLVSMMRNLGVTELPQTDLIAYLREV